MEARDIKKLYYSISEVSEITELKQYVLRYWETEFSQLKPSKNRAGNRVFRPKDIKLVLLVKHLLYEKKFTIDGARQRLLEMKKQGAVAEGGQELLDHEFLTGIEKELAHLQEVLTAPPSRLES